MKFWKPALKVGISLALIALMVHAFQLRDIGRYFARVDAATVAAAVAIAITVALLHATRWMVVIHAATAERLRYSTALRIVLIGHFFNQVLPSSIGGDAVRIWCAYRAGLDFAAAATTVVVDRGMALFSLLLFTAIGLPWLFEIVEPRAAWALAGVIGVGLVGFAGFVAMSALQPGGTLARSRIARGLLALATSTRKVLADPRSAAVVILASMLSFVVFAFILYWLARGMQVQVSLVDCLLLLPPVMLVTVIPISIAGWGVREGAMVIAFGSVGVPANAAFAISVLFGLTLAAASLPGSVLWWMSGDKLANVTAKVDDLAVQEEVPGR